MSMSIFSSFDALCAKLLGQKVSLCSLCPAKQESTKAFWASDGEVGASAMQKTKDADGINSNVQKPRSQSQYQQQRRPRFAPELDGVHCFETILPY